MGAVLCLRKWEYEWTDADEVKEEGPEYSRFRAGLKTNNVLAFSRKCVWNEHRYSLEGRVFCIMFAWIIEFDLLITCRLTRERQKEMCGTRRTVFAVRALKKAKIRKRFK